MFRKNSKSEVYTFWAIFIIICSLVIVCQIAPIIELGWWSLTNKKLGSSGTFIGLSNYIRVFSSHNYYTVLLQSVIFTVASVSLKLVFGASLAFATVHLMSNSKSGIDTWLVPILLLPWAIPTAASILIWAWMLYDLGGVLNMLLRSIGLISENIAWLGNHKLATASLIVVNTWRGIGFFYSSILAARLCVPRERYYVAFLEQASNWLIFRKITLPGIFSTLLVLCLISTVNTFTDFQIVHLLTDGGPGDTTQVFSTMVFEYSFKGRASLGFAAAFAISLSLFLFIPIMVIMKYFYRNNSRMSEG